MSPADYLITFYSVIAGLTATVYIQKWGELLQIRHQVYSPAIPLLWSFCFFVMVINEWFLNFNWEVDTNAFMFLMSLFIPFIYYFIGMLLFPTTDRLNKNVFYDYLDYFEHFLEQKTLIMSLALLAFMLKFFALWFYLDTDLDLFTVFWKFLFSSRNYLVFLALFLALWVEHKVILFLLALIIVYVWGTTFSYVSIQS